jgi:hypothetical protein
VTIIPSPRRVRWCIAVQTARRRADIFLLIL